MQSHGLAEESKAMIASRMDDNGRSLQRRINELINSRYTPGVETPEQMFQRIQEITEIVCSHFIKF
jgi:hypothetical protein